MADEKYTFEQARIRLEEIAAEVRKKDTSLEKSLDLLEEGVRLANICTELVDHTDVSASIAAEDTGDTESGVAQDASDVADDAAPEVDGFEDVEEPTTPDADEGAED